MMMSMPQSGTNTVNANTQDQKSPEYRDKMMFRLSQALVVAIPLSSVLAGWIEHLKQPKNTPTTYNANIHGINPMAQEGGKGLQNKASFLNQYSTDFSKSVQSAWRITTVLPTDILRYGFRGFSLLYIQPLLEIVRRISRSLSSPMIREAILPTVNGRNLEGAREFYPHLTNYEFSELKKEIGDSQLDQLEGLQDALTQDSMAKNGGDYKYLSHAMNVLKFHRVNPETGKYETMPLSRLPVLTRHIRIMTQPDSLAATNATLSKYGHRHIPNYSTTQLVDGKIVQLGKAAIQHDLFTGPVGAYEHVVHNLKLGDFMPEYQQFLQLASQGRFATNGIFHRDVAQRLFDMHTSEPVERDFRINHAFLEYLFKFAKLEGKGEGQIPFGRDTLGYIKHSLLKEFSQPLDPSKIKNPEDKRTLENERLMSVLRKVVGNESLVLDDNTTRKIGMHFDGDRALNIESMGISNFAKEVGPHLERLRTNVEAVKALLNDPHISPERFQAESKKLLAEFELERLRLATVFPSSHPKGVAALNKVLQEGLVENSIKNAYTFVTQGIRHYIAIHHTIPSAKKRLIVPEVLLNSILGFSFLGFLWNALDVHRIQPYEAKISDTKGDVKGSGLMLGLAIVPGATIFTSLLASGALRKWTQDSPTLRFAISSIAGLAISSFCAYHLVRGKLESKPDVAQKKRFSLKSRVEIYHTHHSEIIKQVKNHQRVHRTNEIRPYPKTLSPLH
ncbi:MAG: hypothetical protein ACK551_06350 [Vampirovibrionales bacterium]